MLSYIDGIERKKERFIILPMDFYFDTISLFKITWTNSKGKFIFHLFFFFFGTLDRFKGECNFSNSPISIILQMGN